MNWYRPARHLFYPLLLFNLLFTLAVRQPAKAQDVSRAQQLEQAGQIETAFKIYLDALHKNPDQPLALNGLIRTARRLERYDTLLTVLEPLKPLTRNPAAVELGIVEALFGLKRRSEAIRRLDQLLRSHPEQLVPAIDILILAKELPLAIRYLEPAVNTRFRPDLAERLINLYEQTGQLATAAALLARAVNNDNDAARLLARSAERLRSWGRQPATGRILAELGKIQEPALRTRAQAQVLLGAGREGDAARLFLNNIHSQTVLLDFARECETNGFYQAALTIYQFLGMNPDAARVLRQQGKVELALKILESDTTPAGLFEYAEITRQAQNDFTRAAATYHRLLRFRPDDPAVISGLAAALLGLKQLDSARMVLNRLNRADDRATLLTVKIFIYQGKFDSAAALIREFATRFPDSPLFNDILELGVVMLLGERKNEIATVMFNLDAAQFESARQQAEVIAAGNDLAAQQALLLLSEIFLRQNRYQPAVTILDTLLNRFPEGELAPAALFRQAVLFHDYLKDPARARQSAEKLIEQFPGSPFAPLARNRLLTGIVTPELVH
jgi:tetratricopeptide (TPR) repeat protein